MASEVPDNVANPSLYRKAKAKAKAKFDVYPSAYANGWMVQEYKRMGGKYKGATGGEVTLNPKKSNPNTPNTCLLYTSPSPRDRQKSRMPSSA